MAYTLPRSEDTNTTLWVLGGLGVLAYLYYEGYLNGVVSPATNPSTDVTSGSIAPNVTQVANGEPFQVAQGASGSIVHPPGSSVIGIRQGGAPIGSRGPIASNSQVSNPNSVYSGGVSPSIWDLANESYYTWRASGEPYSRLLEIEAAANAVENGLYGGGQEVSVESGAPGTSVNEVANTPTVTSVATPSPSSPIVYTPQGLTSQLSVPGGPAPDQGAISQLVSILNNAPINSQAFLDRSAAAQAQSQASIAANAAAINALYAKGGSPMYPVAGVIYDALGNPTNFGTSNVNTISNPLPNPVSHPSAGSTVGRG